MPIRSIIIDDEPLARKGLQEYIKEVDFLSLLGSFENPLAASELMMKEPIDLIFLDIQMPKISGLDFMKSLAAPPVVIFTTAYPQYAIDGFELNAIDYLLKPFSFDRFYKAVLKARSTIEGKAGESSDLSDYIFIKTDSKLVKLRFADILFVEALQNYVAVQTNEKRFITYLTFKAVEESLPGNLFLKVHKSYLVAIDKVDSIENNELRIRQHAIPISRNLKDEVMEKLIKGRFLRR